ncbi:unnamed protein product [Moneuplotes crassus]|uniref:Uncharacterized protein n=1 Tax=Euplotes crassus TaxID=5936 RepID=A0AAD1XY72_EUPCR|nr:unnamed protein product [Moneuplotes crassus]
MQNFYRNDTLSTRKPLMAHKESKNNKEQKEKKLFVKRNQNYSKMKRMMSPQAPNMAKLGVDLKFLKNPRRSRLRNFNVSPHSKGNPTPNNPYQNTIQLKSQKKKENNLKKTKTQNGSKKNEFGRMLSHIQPTSPFNPNDLASTRNTTPLSNLGESNPTFIPKKKRKPAMIKNQKTLGGNAHPKENKNNMNLSGKKRRLTRPTLTGVIISKFMNQYKKEKSPKKIEMPKIFEKKKTTRKERVVSFEAKPRGLASRVKAASKTPLFSSIKRQLGNMTFIGRNITPIIKNYKAKNKNKFVKSKPKKKVKLEMAKNIEENSRVNMRYFSRNNPENMSVMSSRAIRRLHDTVGSGDQRDSSLAFSLRL